MTANKKQKRAIRAVAAAADRKYQSVHNLVARSEKSQKGSEQVTEILDPTRAVAEPLRERLRGQFPGARVDHSPGGLYAPNDPTPTAERVFRSHSVAVKPQGNGASTIAIEVRTGERREQTSTFRVWTWIGGGDQKQLVVDQVIDILSKSEVDDYVLDAVRAATARAPNARPLVPGQQLRFAVENQRYAFRGPPGSVVTVQASSLRPQNLKGPFVEMVETVPVELLVDDDDDDGVRCSYLGALHVNDVDVSWGERRGGLAAWLRAQLGKSCEGVELLGPRTGDSIRVRARFFLDASHPMVLPGLRTGTARKLWLARTRTGFDCGGPGVDPNDSAVSLRRVASDGRETIGCCVWRRRSANEVAVVQMADGEVVAIGDEGGAWGAVIGVMNSNGRFEAL